MITDNTITRNDVVINFKAPLADTADYARVIPGAIDSARVAANAHKLQGKDTIDFDARYVNEGQINSITNTMLQNTSVTNLKLAANSVSTDKIIDGTIGENDIEDGAITYGKIDRDAVTTNEIFDGTIVRGDVSVSFKAPYADTADYARVSPVADSVQIAVNAYNAYKLQGKDTVGLSAKYVDEGQANSIASAMIINNTITRNDVSTNFKAPFADTSDYARISPVADSVRIAVNAYNAYKLQDKDTTALSNKFVDENQTNAISNGMIIDGAVNNAKLGPNAVTTNKIQDGTITTSDLAFTPVTRPFSPLISGSEIAKPCTLEASITLSESPVAKVNKRSEKQRDFGALLNVKNNGSGDGVRVITSGRDAFNVSHADGAGFSVNGTSQDGLNVGHAEWDALYAYRVDQDGVYIDSAGNNGIWVNQTGNNGVQIDNAGDMGVYIQNSEYDGFAIDNAGNNGLSVINAWNIGNYVQNSGTDAFCAHQAGDNGLRVTYANTNGVYVDSANEYGVYASGNQGGVLGQSDNGYGVKAISSSGTALKVEGTSEFTGQITSSATDREAPIEVASTALCPNLNADLLDGYNASDFTSASTDYGRAGVSTNLYEGTTALTDKYVNEGQTNAISTGMVTDTNITMVKIQRAGATTGQVLKWTGSAWAPRNDSASSGLFLPLAGGNMTGTVTNTGNPSITMGKGNFGTNNINSGTDAFVAGNNNKARGAYSVVCGGGGTGADSNSAISAYSTIGGGVRNTSSNSYATVGGGTINIASGDRSTVGGGSDNIANSYSATVSGGKSNTASNQYTTVGGGNTNTASSSDATIAGGSGNTASGGGSLVSGGIGNVASSYTATVCGGYNNTATDSSATVSGGRFNHARGLYSVVCGGGGPVAADSNSTSGKFSAIVGGRRNNARGDSSFIGGGVRNNAWGTISIVGGGRYNDATGYGATVGGGQDHDASGNYSTVAGGYNCDAWLEGTTISGGAHNIAESAYATVGGGRFNRAYGQFSVITGGGGYNDSDSNLAFGNYSMIPGGRGNKTLGTNSFAAGRRAKANHNGSFVWADSKDADFSSQRINQFRIRADGGARIDVNDSTWVDIRDTSDAYDGYIILTSVGARLTRWGYWYGGGREPDNKANLTPSDNQVLLENLSKMPISKWSNKGEQGVKHIGPTAQDFYNAFGLGVDGKSISSVDPDGVALAAIQELIKENRELRNEIEQIKKQLKNNETK
jgi:hypothetical protein